VPQKSRNARLDCVSLRNFREEAIMSGAQTSHFRQAFDISRAMHVIISTSLRTGIPMCVPRVVGALCEAFPDAKQAPETVERALLMAAEEAGAEIASAPTAWAA
jgi:hypothetical protein